MKYKTGIELITQERKAQQKAGKSPDGYDIDLMSLIRSMLTKYDRPSEAQTDAAIIASLNEWHPPYVETLITRPYKERLIIAGALIAAEIDRLNYSDNTQ